jgi:hypothetical protein
MKWIVSGGVSFALAIADNVGPIHFMLAMTATLCAYFADTD